MLPPLSLPCLYFVFCPFSSVWSCTLKLWFITILRIEIKNIMTQWIFIWGPYFKTLVCYIIIMIFLNLYSSESSAGQCESWEMCRCTWQDSEAAALMSWSDFLVFLSKWTWDHHLGNFSGWCEAEWPAVHLFWDGRPFWTGKTSVLSLGFSLSIFLGVSSSGEIILAVP